jgi:hypothetical protein
MFSFSAKPISSLCIIWRAFQKAPPSNIWPSIKYKSMWPPKCYLMKFLVVELKVNCENRVRVLGRIINIIEMNLHTCNADGIEECRNYIVYSKNTDR